MVSPDAILIGVLWILVTVECKARKVTVRGERGKVVKDYSHLPCEIQAVSSAGKKRPGPHLRIRMWFGGYKQACSVNTLKSHILNMITGVTEVSTTFLVNSELSNAYFVRVVTLSLILSILF